MDTRSKVTVSCGIAMLLLVAGVIIFFVMLFNSLATDPIKGWQEGPHTPTPPLTVYVSPEPSATTKPSIEKTEHP
jgi:hypothetical protein